jgi:hypothetical protein
LVKLANYLGTSEGLAGTALYTYRGVAELGESGGLEIKTPYHE